MMPGLQPIPTVMILWPDGRREHLPLAYKEDIAAAVWQRAYQCRQDLLLLMTVAV